MQEEAAQIKVRSFPGFLPALFLRTVGGVGEFLAEVYVAESDAASVERGAELARKGAEHAVSTGASVRYVRTIFVPEDETCFYLYEAPSADAVLEAGRRAGLTFERIKAVA
jgi:hypothetical protein